MPSGEPGPGSRVDPVISGIVPDLLGVVWLAARWLRAKALATSTQPRHAVSSAKSRRKSARGNEATALRAAVPAHKHEDSRKDRRAQAP